MSRRTSPTPWLPRVTLLCAVVVLTATVAVLPLPVAQAATTQGQASAEAAASQAGVAYCFDGGTTSGPTHGSGGAGCSGSTQGFDCSGLALYAVYQATGITLPHVAGQEATYGVTVISSESNLQPGDLVFFGGGSMANADHVGIYAGNGAMWDANDFNVPVQEHTLKWEEHALAFDGGVRYGSGKAAPPSVTNALGTL